MKKLTFLGDSIDRLRDFPREAQQVAGYQLHLVQIGENPDD
jgi:phage-related protein